MATIQGVRLTSYVKELLFMKPQDEIILRGVEKDADVPTVKVKDVADTTETKNLEKRQQDALQTKFEELSQKWWSETLPATNVDSISGTIRCRGLRFQRLVQQLD